MRATSLFCVVSAGAALMAASVTWADPLDEAAIHAEPQYYLMSLPAAPVGEIAEAVLGEALGLPYKVDEDVDAQMRFQVDGVYGPKALVQEFGYRLWNADVALIERPSDGLWLIPRSELPAALAQGASLVAPPASAPAPVPRKKAPPSSTGVSSKNRAEPTQSNWAWPVWLALGWAGGALSVIGLKGLRRPRSPKLALLLDAASVSPAPHDPDELIIPNFAASAADRTQPKAP